MRATIDELEIKSRTNNITDIYRGINDFTKSYQVRTIKDEKGDLVTDSHSNLARWRNHLSQQLNVKGVNDVRHTEIPWCLSRVPLGLSWQLKS